MKAEQILDAVCAALEIDKELVQSGCRIGEVCEARFIATRLMFENDIAPAKIMVVINRHRTNIYYQMEIAGNRINNEPDFRFKYNLCKSKIQHDKV